MTLGDLGGLPEAPVRGASVYPIGAAPAVK